MLTVTNLSIRTKQTKETLGAHSHAGDLGILPGEVGTVQLDAQAIEHLLLEGLILLQQMCIRDSNYSMSCNMWVYHGYLYLGTYNDPMLDLAEIPASGNFELLYNDLDHSI